MGKEGQIKVIGFTAIIYGILLIIFFGAISIFWTAVSETQIGEPLWILILIIGLLYLSIYIISGVGLLKHKNWARVILIILSILGLLNFPIGTGLGIWFLIVLFDKDVKASMK